MFSYKALPFETGQYFVIDLTSEIAVVRVNDMWGQVLQMP